MVIKIPEQVNRALEILQGNGHSAYVVGGAVRDAVTGRPVNDWDITTSASPSETTEAFSGFKTVETGLKHGTLTVIIDSMSIEITTFRIEGAYSDNRHPDSVNFTDKVEDDLARRDFTVNSIAYSPLKGFVDPFGGIDDINKKIIRCVGNPDKRFGEDALRILRALRFSSVLGFEIEPKTAKSIHRNYHLLGNISVERIFNEFTKLLCGADAEKILREYEDVIFFILPELKPMKNCLQNHERHIYDVWGHTVNAVKNIIPDAELRYAMLFHDSGKPKCKSTDEKGIDHFYSHGKISKAIANDTLIRLKTSTNFRQKVCNYVEYHDFLPNKISKKTYKKYISKLGIETVKNLFEIRKADILAQNPAFHEQSLKENETGLKILKEIETEENCFEINDLKINGNDIIALGVEPSHKIGNILETLLDEVMEDKLKNEKDALLKRAEELRRKLWKL